MIPIDNGGKRKTIRGPIYNMKIGLNIFPTDKAISPVDLAKEAESRGFESLWFPEHSHIPTSRETPWGGDPSLPPLPEMYWRTIDQFVALSAAAASTTELKIGTGITLVAQRDPIWLAKEVASLDYISNGRLLFGIGYGWCVEEMRNHGVNYNERRDILREKILLMKELWVKEEAEFRGNIHQLEKSWAWPKPVQKPHPPVILGGAVGKKTARHIAEFCDGWMPLGRYGDIEKGITLIQDAAAEIGRDLSNFETSMFCVTPVNKDKIAKLSEQGLTRIILPLPAEDETSVLPILDEYSALI